MNELKKKLAEWAFPNATSIDDMGDHLWVHHPFGSKHTLGSLSVDFESLDACFKWLVPKLELKMIDSIVFSKSMTGNHWWCHLEYPDKQRIEAMDFIEDNPTPALAFCLAVEKLIDGEKND